MNRTLKAMSLLLSYPTEELKGEIGAIETALHADARLRPSALRALGALLAEIRDADIYDLEARYVTLFDRSRSLSLNLFEHVHGESRERGGAMVDLLETYRAGGFEPSGLELPDHLPTLLEFLATRPEPEARALLAEAAHILEAIALRLGRRESAYAGVLSALVDYCQARRRPTVAAAAAALAAEPEDDPDDLEALDAVWEEAAVVFGPDPNAGCPATRDLLARMEARPDAEPAPSPTPARDKGASLATAK